MRRESTGQRTILIAATHRSGSYLACDWLSQLGGIPFAEEYFNFNLLAARQELRLADGLPKLAVLERLMADQRATARRFAVKAMWPAFASLFHQIAADSKDPVADPLAAALDILGDIRVVLVRRRDKAKQAVSFEKAKQQGVWRSQQRDEGLDATLVYNYARILDCWNQVHEDEANWLKFFEERQLPYFEIWYEDMVADPMRIVGNALTFLGVESKSGVAIQSRYQKLSSGLNAEWLKRFQSRQKMQLSVAQEQGHRRAASLGLNRGGGTVFQSLGKSLRRLAGAGLNRRNPVPAEKPQVALKCRHTMPIQMSPDTAQIVECELFNVGTREWLPALCADGNANYALELRARSAGASKDSTVLWRTDVEQLPPLRQSVSLTLRLSLGVVLDDSDYDLFFCYPGGAFQVPESIAVQVKLDEKWQFLRRVFGQVAASDMSGWVHVPALGDLWTDCFPFVYQHEHGWLYVDVENSAPGVFRSGDFELQYFVLHVNEPRIYHLGTGEQSQRLEFLGTRNEQRAFRNPETGEMSFYPLSTKPNEEQ